MFQNKGKITLGVLLVLGLVLGLVFAYLHTQSIEAHPDPADQLTAYTAIPNSSVGTDAYITLIDTTNSTTIDVLNVASATSTGVIIFVWDYLGGSSSQPLEAYCSSLAAQASWSLESIHPSAESGIAYSIDADNYQAACTAAQAVSSAAGWGTWISTYYDAHPGQNIAVTVKREKEEGLSSYTAQPLDMLGGPPPDGGQITFLYLLFPVYKNYSGITSRLAIQNASFDPWWPYPYPDADVDIYYFDADGSSVVAHVNVYIAPAETCRISSPLILPDGWVGSAVIRSNAGSLSIVIDQESSLATHSGVAKDVLVLPDIEDTTLYAPLFFKGQENWSTEVTVQNFSEIADAYLKIEFLDENGSVVEEGGPYNIEERGSRTIVLTVSGAAAVRITSPYVEDNPPIAGVVTITNSVTGEMVSYNALPEKKIEGENKIFLPGIEKQQVKEMLVANFGSVASTSIIIDFYDQNGDLVSSYSPVENVVTEIDLSAISELPPDYKGSAVITVSGTKVMAGLATGSNTAPGSPTSLETEDQTNPANIIDIDPEFTAIAHDSDGNTLTHAYIQVGTSSGASDIWDSGWINIDDISSGQRCTAINYAGSTLSLDGSKYYWRIKFKDSFGAEGHWSSEEAYFTMQEPPETPSGALLDTITSSSMRLTWQDNSSYEDGFRIRKSTNGTDYTLVDTVTANLEEYTGAGIFSLTPKTQYWFQVSSYNTAGESSPSTALPKYTLADKPASLDLIAVPEELLADGKSQSVLTAEVKDQGKNYVADGTEVSFEISQGGGSLSSSEAETTDGEASVTYTAGTEAGTVKIKATSDSISDEVELTLFKPALSLTKSVKIGSQASALGAAASSFFTFPTWLLFLGLIFFIILFIKKKRNPHPDGKTVSFIVLFALAFIGCLSIISLRNIRAFEDAGNTVNPGDTLTYKIAYQNTSDTDAEDVVIIDSIPSGSSYVSGSLNINGNSKTDALDQDEADFDESNFKACTFNLGTVSSTSSGYVTFQVQVNDPKEVDAVENQGQANFNPGEFTLFSNTVSNPVEEEALPPVPPKGSIGDLVFEDSNRDGKYTEEEPGITEVTLKLYQDTDHDTNLSYTYDELLKTTVTDSNGGYDFLELDMGAYIVDVDETSLPEDYELTTDNEPLYIELAKDQDYDEADFGYAKKVVVVPPEVTPPEVIPPEVTPPEEVPPEIPGITKPIPTKKAKPKVEVPKVEVPVPAAKPKTLSERLSQRTVDAIKTILPKGIAEFYEKNIIQNKTAQTAIQATAVPLVTATSIGITAATIATTSIAFGPYLAYLWQFLVSPLAMLSRKRRKAWGTVYNSLTKQPVDLAMVRLWDGRTKKLLQTKVTGRDGRYMFLVPVERAGEPQKQYYVTVTKPDYEFPCRILEKAEKDTMYQDLYYGEPLIIKPELTQVQRKEGKVILPQEVVNLNIPLDSHSNTVFAPGLTYGQKTKINSLSDLIGLSQEERIKENQALIASYRKVHQRRIVSSLGPVLGFVCFILSPSLYTILLFVAQLLACFLFRRLALSYEPKAWGKVKEERTKKGLPLAIIRLFDKRYGRLLLTKVTPHQGRYGFLVGKENYILTCEKEGYQAPPKLEILGTKEGIVRKDVEMRKR